MVCSYGTAIAPVRSGLFSELGFPTGRQSDEKRYYPNIKRNEMVAKGMWPHNPATAVEVRLTLQFSFE